MVMSPEREVQMLDDNSENLLERSNGKKNHKIKCRRNKSKEKKERKKIHLSSARGAGNKHKNSEV